MRNSLRKKRPFFFAQDGAELLPCDPEFESALIKGQIRGLLLDWVEELPKKQQKALYMRVFDEMSFKEISQEMECPYDTAKANYRHALLKLRKKAQQSQQKKDLFDWCNENQATPTGAFV